MIQINFNINNIELGLFYNLVLTYLTLKLLINWPKVNTSVFIPTVYFYYLLMLTYIGYLYWNNLYFDEHFKLNNEEQYFSKKLDLLFMTYNLTISNMIEFIIILIFYTYTYISYEYYNTELNNFDNKFNHIENINKKQDIGDINQKKSDDNEDKKSYNNEEKKTYDDEDTDDEDTDDDDEDTDDLYEENTDDDDDEDTDEDTDDFYEENTDEDEYEDRFNEETDEEVDGYEETDKDNNLKIPDLTPIA